MKKEPFLLVSLEESESKALAQVISNDTARKILDLLSKEESVTATDIGKKLKVPLSTVHYNLQALVKANLVAAEEFHYSEKGKEVLHYALANKLIIIASKKTSTESFRDKLRSILPVGLIALGAGIVIEIVTRMNSLFSAGATYTGGEAPMMLKATADAAPELARGIAEEAAIGAADEAAVFAAPQVANVASGQPSIAVWFMLGAAFTILVLLVWYYFVTRKNVKE